MTTGVAASNPIMQFLDNAGNPAVGGSVLTQVGGVNYATYSDSGLTTALPNPIPLNSRGEASTAAGTSSQVFLEPNTVYTFTLSDANGNQLWQATYVDGVQFSITQAEVAELLWPQTAAEIAAGVTPTNYAYPGPGQANCVNAKRYGFVGDGVADDTVALQTLFTVCQQGFIAWIPFSGTGAYKVSGPLYFDGHGGLVMEGAFKAYLSATGTGYTVLNIATKSSSILENVFMCVNGNNLAVNGIQVGNADQSTTICNVEQSYIQYLNVQNCAGFGVQINASFDSHFGSIHADYCGTSTEYAFSINNAGNTANQCSFSKIQVEAGTTKAVFIDEILTCDISQLHAERAVGTAGTYTHIFGGSTVRYGPMYLEGATNGSVLFNGAGCIFDGIECNDSPCSYSGSIGTINFGSSSNVIVGLNTSSLTELSGNIGAWVFRESTVSGTTAIQSGHVYTRFFNCFLSAMSFSGAGSGFEAFHTTISGTLTGVVAASFKAVGCTVTNFPPCFTVNLIDTTVTNAFTTIGNQVIRANGCTFSGLVTLNGSPMDWRSDGCTFSAGATYTAGAPGVLFGPMDSFPTAVTSTYLTENPQTAGSNTAYHVGDKGFNPAPTATGPFGWTCTTAGTPGTWTNLTLP